MCCEVAEKSGGLFCVTINEKSTPNVFPSNALSTISLLRRYASRISRLYRLRSMACLNCRFGTENITLAQPAISVGL